MRRLSRRHDHDDAQSSYSTGSRILSCSSRPANGTRVQCLHLAKIDLISDPQPTQSVLFHSTTIIKTIFSLSISNKNSSGRMETLLSHSFDYLSSSSPQKIRKGLRQLEGLLAQICLARSSTANKRHSMMPLGQQFPPSSRRLADLRDDPAFREFFKLQQGFQWNVAMRLISCLERLMGKGTNGQNDLLIISTLDLLQGVLLLHPPSRDLFAREIHMNVCGLPVQSLGTKLMRL